MKISAGLFDRCVLQRNRQNVSDALITFDLPLSAPAATVTEGTRRPKNIKIGAVPGQKNQIRLKGIPAGGPYTITITDGDAACAVSNVLVGDVWLLGGQSNMEGIGLLKDRPATDPLVRAYYMHDVWKTAKDPIHNLGSAKAAVHYERAGKVERSPYVGVGPGVSFGQEMRQLTGVPQGLIACAHGGTSMSEWDPAKKKMGDHSLYGAAINRFKRNGSKVKGLVWYQGESDAGEPAVGLYTERMQKLIRAFRRDTGDKQLPVAMVQIGRILKTCLGEADAWNRIQEQQRVMPQKIRHLTVVPSVNLEMDDQVHISGKDQQTLGRNLARAMARMLGNTKAGLPPIELKKISTELSRNDRSRIVIEFANVEGKLIADGRPHGFGLLANLPMDEVVKVELKGKKALIETILPLPMLQELSVAYGVGCNPYCNITDGTGRSLPVFTAKQLRKSTARTSFIQNLRVSSPQPAAEIASLVLPKKLNFVGHLFPSPFLDVRELYGGGNKLLWLACKVECSEPMKLKAAFGYDGPFKAWCDRKEIFCDPAGTNPALPHDKGIAVLQLPAGKHEIIMALGTNNGLAWGICFHMERLDVTPAQLRKGRDAYVMPTILG